MARLPAKPLGSALRMTGAATDPPLEIFAMLKNSALLLSLPLFRNKHRDIPAWLNSYKHTGL
jgi:hypothetical protein